MRIPRDVNGQRLGVGTLRQILKDVASPLGCSIEELIGSLEVRGQGLQAAPLGRGDQTAAA